MSALTDSAMPQTELLPLTDDGSRQREVRLRYMPALDGLRALAAAVVLLYHADIGWMPGGFLGVEVFFVLSGYLITSLLLAEWRQTGHLRLGKFALRRVRRLFPAMLLMTAASIAYAVLFLPDEVARLGRDAVAGLGYVTNWHLIFSRTSYFESAGRPSILRHLWSLAIEGQLYVLWPLVVSLLIGRWKGRWVPVFAFLVAAASALWMGFLYHPDVDPSRVYYGTDTRSAGFLLGAILAFLPLTDRPAKGVAPWLFDFAGLASLGLLAWACVYINAYEPLLYRGGLGIVAGATFLVIAAIVRPGTHLVRGLLGWGPLRWIGLRSYGIYLWHWPVFMLTRPELDLPLDGVPLLALRLVLTLVLTEISYRSVEKPLHQGALGRAHRAFDQAQGARRLTLGLRWGGAFIGLAVASVVLGRAVVNSQPSTPAWYAGKESVRTVLSSPTVELDQRGGILTPTVIEEPILAGPTVSYPILTPPVSPQATTDGPTSGAAAETDVPLAPTPTASGSGDGVGLAPPSATPDETDVPIASSSPDNIGSPEPLGSSPAAAPSATTVAVGVPAPEPTSAQDDGLDPLPEVPTESPDSVRVIAIGDSVMVSAADELTHGIEGLSMDAAIGRQMREVIEVLQEIAKADQMGDVMIVQVGNNGYLSAKKFDEMMELLTDVQAVFILNCRVPRQWEETVNEVLAKGVERYPNATLVDWYAASAEHPEFFWKDGMHLRPEGAKAYADLISEHLGAVLD